MYPALAVAEALRAPAGAGADGDDRRPSVVYVGSRDGMEAGLVAKESDLPFRAVPAAALRGRSPLTLARNLGTLAAGTRIAARLLRELRPGAVLGTGGYVCVPLFLAARLARVPTMIYLPDVVPGLAIRFLARVATVVACNVEDSLPFFRGRRPQPVDSLRRSAPSGSPIVVTGYPVRAELFAQDQHACRSAFGLDQNAPVVFVYGGSRGARSVNQAVAALLPHLLPLAQIIHVCGREGDEAFLQAAAERLPEPLRERYRLYPYLFSGAQPVSAGDVPPASMLTAFGAATLAVCRSGASTLAELPAAGLPAVLVPYPYVHQDENADYLVRRGAAVKVADAAMLGDGRPEEGPLFQQIRGLLERDGERTRMSERSRALARPDAARHLADLLLALADSREAGR
ncbi:MAG TPA: UDP-N-acetylglucosamine--N-acetylmuramyl-(pentapeptide) pyrophosphoryl-undecaprenol N-acetylglucosamine transferase [Roseiflexaceae bacterium]|nr:UDP-N-acetylglucosamine--N-acetylmuramyl-(pentapeptide) pyrophosphoryl-undecaprenol N-acetylglucosamine transferase [Roseiflexaceae bacterium]